MLRIQKKIEEHDFEEWMDLLLGWAVVIFVVGVICAMLGGALAGSQEIFTLFLMIATAPFLLLMVLLILYIGKMGIGELISDTKRMLK